MFTGHFLIPLVYTANYLQNSSTMDLTVCLWCKSNKQSNVIPNPDLDGIW